MMDNREVEEIWRGEFGRSYTDRNCHEGTNSGVFHRTLCDRLRARRILEVGCNVGLNLSRLVSEESLEVWGIDVNDYALLEAKKRLPHARFALASASQLPFPDGAFDLTFTCGVLIHIPPHLLEKTMGEVHRTSCRYIWCGEYYSENPEEITYQGRGGLLFKRDFGADYLRAFPGLRMVEKGFFGKAETGFDNLTWWLFEKGHTGA